MRAHLVLRMQLSEAMWRCRVGAVTGMSFDLSRRSISFSFWSSRLKSSREAEVGSHLVLCLAWREVRLAKMASSIGLDSGGGQSETTINYGAST
jgi:hypothetical protein